ncbi:MAG: DUF1929 domain-containing protein [Solirubrobacterales bacterium]|nr:DUF1929 domain-containing protein [Solirubrobacterales bacterium]
MQSKNSEARLTRRVAAASAAFIFISPAAALADGSLPGGSPGANDPITKLLAPAIAPTSGNPADDGAFGAPFVEPNIGDKTTAAKCLDGAGPNGLKRCKPAAGTNIVLPNGKLLYFDNLGGTENVKFSIVGEYGAVATNDETRLLDLGKGAAAPSWTLPSPVDGGANPDGERESEPLIPGLETTEPFNDGALFGAGQVFLPDGKVLLQGGTDYSLDPGVDGLPIGVVELSGLRQTRIYDPKTNTFNQTGNTTRGRWYPTQVSLGDGSSLVIGGVTKLLKPIYKEDLTQSGQNVLTSERYNSATGKWTGEGDSAKQDLPLYPRLHLLPNGNVFFNASGQSFNPFGQSLGQAGWINTKVYDTKKRTWRDTAIPGLTDIGPGKHDGPLGPIPSLFPGYRGSMTSTLMPLEPDADGNYKKASFLTAGGVLALSPGSYLPVADSRITDVDTSGARETQKTRKTGPLAETRWFGSQVLLPTGDVMQFSGADKDEVVGPGTEFPRQQAEIFDAETETWRPAAVAQQPRTYHNTAVLLPSGEVLIGGHATISTLYLNNTTLPGGFAPHDGRDPSFEIYKPPYLFRGKRPVIESTQKTLDFGKTFDVKLAPGTDATDIDSIRLVRNTATTHLIDADQRQVVLPIVARNGRTVTVKGPPNGDVAPPGPYMLFANGKSDQGPVPSVAATMMVGTDAQRSSVFPGTPSVPKGGAADNANKQIPKTRCVSRRAFTVKVRKQLRKRVVRASFAVDGKRVAKRRASRNQKTPIKARVSLKGKRSATSTVKIVMRLRNGKTLRDVRRYKLCAEKATTRTNFKKKSSRN